MSDEHEKKSYSVREEYDSYEVVYVGNHPGFLINEKSQTNVVKYC